METTHATHSADCSCTPLILSNPGKREQFSENTPICNSLACNPCHAAYASGEVAASPMQEFEMTQRLLAASSDALRNHSDDDLVPVPVACMAIGKSVNSLYRMFADGTLTKHKIGGSTRVRVRELRKLIGGF